MHLPLPFMLWGNFLDSVNLIIYHIYLCVCAFGSIHVFSNLCCIQVNLFLNSIEFNWTRYSYEVCLKDFHIWYSVPCHVCNTYLLSISWFYGMCIMQGSTLTVFLSSLSDLYLPKRKIYLPKNDNTKKKDKHYYFSLIFNT